MPYFISQIPEASSVSPSLVVVQSLNRVQLFATPWAVGHQAPLSSTTSWSLLKCMSIELVMLTVSSSAAPFSFCLKSFPVSWSFPMSQQFKLGGQIIGTSQYIFVLGFVLFCFWLHHAACGILVHQPGMEPVPPALEAWSLDHWSEGQGSPKHTSVGWLNS